MTLVIGSGLVEPPRIFTNDGFLRIQVFLFDLLGLRESQLLFQAVVTISREPKDRE